MTATCKDCLCYDACQYHITEETAFTVEECSTGFKHKDLYVKLPVYIGQVVWRLNRNWYDDSVAVVEGRVSMLQQKADMSWKFRVSENGSVSDYLAKQIGQDIFISKDEADAARKILSEEIH